MTTEHEKPARAALQRFRDAYPALFCNRSPSELALLDRLWCEGWLAAAVAMQDAIYGTTNASN